jgi:hypothetical protein
LLYIYVPRGAFLRKYKPILSATSICHADMNTKAEYYFAVFNDTGSASKLLKQSSPKPKNRNCVLMIGELVVARMDLLNKLAPVMSINLAVCG